MTISVEKAHDEIYYLVTKNRTQNKNRNFLNLINFIFIKPLELKYWIVEYWMIFFLRSGTRSLLEIITFLSVGPNQYSKARKWNKWWKDGKRRNKTIFTHRWHHICEKSKGIHQPLELLGECSKVNR